MQEVKLGRMSYLFCVSNIPPPPPPRNSCDLVFVTLAYNDHVQEYQLLLISVAGPATVEDVQQACLVDPSQFYF